MNNKSGQTSGRIGFFITLLFGFVAGFSTHALTVKVDFKEKIIDKKIEAYGDVITHWVRMRNAIALRYGSNQNKLSKLLPGAGKYISTDDLFREAELVYGKFQEDLGKVILLTDNEKIIWEIERIQELLTSLAHSTEDTMTAEAANGFLNHIKERARGIVTLMKEDIRESAKLTGKDIKDMIISLGKW